jgi:hypothetical protein
MWYHGWRTEVERREQVVPDEVEHVAAVLELIGGFERYIQWRHNRPFLVPYPDAATLAFTYPSRKFRRPFRYFLISQSKTVNPAVDIRILSLNRK